MEIGLFNDHVLRVLIAARPRDSVLGIAKRTGLSYAWTHKWVSDLIAEGVFSREGKNLALNEHHAFYQSFLAFFRDRAQQSPALHYEALALAGLPYAFTENDAAFFWTQGGYDVARNRAHYPIFIKTRAQDADAWSAFFKKTGFTARDKVEGRGVYIVLRPQQKPFTIDFVDATPVVPLREAVAFMKRFKPNYLPALEMVNRAHHLGLNIHYAQT